MSTFQVIARKWRPQRFDDVIGQRGVTQTLQNAIGAKRIAQSFVFSGPRGVGKTTTARILARALNYALPDGSVTGPSIRMPALGLECQAIMESRHVDVLEMDAASHNSVDKVRDIIITGLGIAPVGTAARSSSSTGYRLSPQSFDALLKSIEEPPPHVSS